MLRAPLALSKRVIPHIRGTDDGVGAIGNMASVHGHYVTSDKVAYDGSKFGLRGLTQSIAAEGGDGLRGSPFARARQDAAGRRPDSRHRRATGLSVDEVIDDVCWARPESGVEA